MDGPCVHRRGGPHHSDRLEWLNVMRSLSVSLAVSELFWGSLSPGQQHNIRILYINTHPHTNKNERGGKDKGVLPHFPPGGGATHTRPGRSPNARRPKALGALPSPRCGPTAAVVRPGTGAPCPCARSSSSAVNGEQLGSGGGD